MKFIYLKYSIYLAQVELFLLIQLIDVTKLIIHQKQSKSHYLKEKTMNFNLPYHKLTSYEFSRTVSKFVLFL